MTKYEKCKGTHRDICSCSLTLQTTATNAYIYQDSASLMSNCRPAKCVVNPGHRTSLLAEAGSNTLLWHTRDNNSFRNITEHSTHSSACGSGHILSVFLQKLLYFCSSTSKTIHHCLHTSLCKLDWL